MGKSMDRYYFRTKDLAVGYGPKPLIRDINIELKKGEILALVGPNGGGKSTILKSITRQLEAVAGVVYIENRSLRQMRGKELAQKVSVVLTGKVKPEMMSCFEVVASGRYPYTNYFGQLTSQDQQIVEQSLEKVNALELKDRDFRQLSDGQCQRIMLARAICQQTEIIVLDEPTSFLDIRYKIELLDILKTMARKQQVTIIMSLHEIDLAPKIADKIMCVKGDEIEDFGPPGEVLSEEKIRRLYDLDRGAYNMNFGSVELARPQGEPELFVIAGGGYGINVYRELQRKHIPFATGILFEHDIDCEIAASLAAEVVTTEAFYPISAPTYEAAWHLLCRCGCFLDAGTPVGEHNRPLGELVSRARKAGIKEIKHLAGYRCQAEK